MFKILKGSAKLKLPYYDGHFEFQNGGHLKTLIHDNYTSTLCRKSILVAIPMFSR
jgi:hypothetical protein